MSATEKHTHKNKFNSKRNCCPSLSHFVYLCLASVSLCCFFSSRCSSRYKLAECVRATSVLYINGWCTRAEHRATTTAVCVIFLVGFCLTYCQVMMTTETVHRMKFDRKKSHTHTHTLTRSAYLRPIVGEFERKNKKLDCIGSHLFLNISYTFRPVFYLFFLFCLFRSVVRSFVRV